MRRCATRAFLLGLYWRTADICHAAVKRRGDSRLLPVEPQSHSGNIAGFDWRIDSKIEVEPGTNCVATVRSASGRIVFRTSDWDISLESISGKDVNGDGQPDIVFVGYSGGAHCCWTYWIVSLGTQPGLIKKIENERAAEFKPTGPNGRIEMWTLDGAFDYFDDPFPMRRPSFQMLSCESRVTQCEMSRRNTAISLIGRSPRRV